MPFLGRHVLDAQDGYLGVGQGKRLVAGDAPPLQLFGPEVGGTAPREASVERFGEILMVKGTARPFHKNGVKYIALAEIAEDRVEVSLSSSKIGDRLRSLT